MIKKYWANNLDLIPIRELKDLPSGVRPQDCIGIMKEVLLLSEVKEAIETFEKKIADNYDMNSFNFTKDQFFDVDLADWVLFKKQ